MPKLVEPLNTLNAHKIAQTVKENIPKYIAQTEKLLSELSSHTDQAEEDIKSIDICMANLSKEIKAHAQGSKMFNRIETLQQHLSFARCLAEKRVLPNRDIIVDSDAFKAYCGIK